MCVAMSLTLYSRVALLYQRMKDWKSKLQPSGWILYRWQWHKCVEYQNQSMIFVSLFEPRHVTSNNVAFRQV